ncbi:metallophosphoesterase [Candidatus Daviesbacteria bacterium]|nr:metallophosphoesterase [Candidatus Daviesbacteria bacterium]
MFRRHTAHRGMGFSLFGKLFGVFRLFLSLVILSVLVLGIYQAIRSFSGIDPLSANPQSIFNNILQSEDAYTLVKNILTANPQDSINKAKKILSNDNLAQSSSNKTSGSPLTFSFGVVSDSHNDNGNLDKALKQAKGSGAKFVIGLGDYTDVGSISDLRDAKLQFDTFGLPYYVIPGDHDLWEAREKKLPPTTNYKEVFGSDYSSFAYDKVRFILLDNADNYLGVDEVQMKWVEDELIRAKEGDSKLTFIMTAIPLYHPSSDHVMGKLDGKLKNQAEHLMSLFKENNVDAVFSGDTHFFSSYIEPKNNIPMIVSGAVTSTRNPQSPRFIMVDIFEDGRYNVRDIEIRDK